MSLKSIPEVNARNLLEILSNTSSIYTSRFYTDSFMRLFILGRGVPFI